MKTRVLNFIFGRDARVNGAIALSIVMLVALGCTCGKNFDFGNSSSNSNSGKPIFGDNDTDSVDDNLAKATIRATTAEFASAVSTGDFSTLYADTAQEFRNQYTEEQMKSEFGDFVRQKNRVLPIFAKAVSMEPEFTDGPSTRSEGGQSILSASGKYDTKPLPVTFKYEYVKRDGSWKLLRIEVYVR